MSTCSDSRDNVVYWKTKRKINDDLQWVIRFVNRFGKTVSKRRMFVSSMKISACWLLHRWIKFNKICWEKRPAKTRPIWRRDLKNTHPHLKKLPRMPASRFLKYTGRNWPNPVCSFYLPVSTSRDDPTMKQVRKNESVIFWTSFKKRVGKSILTFRTKNLVNFFFEGFRSTLNLLVTTQVNSFSWFARTQGVFICSLFLGVSVPSPCL